MPIVPSIAKRSDRKNGTALARHTVRGAWLSHVGKVRRENEDACLAGLPASGASDDLPSPISISEAPWIIAVSDGIGGHRAGAEASREVVTTLAACKRVTPFGIAEILQRLNRRLCERGRTEREFAAMGATVAGLACGRRGVFAFSVGDSRVYRQEGKRLLQITRDDSQAEQLVEQGLLKPGARPGFLHALTQAIGGREVAVEIEAHIHPLEVKDRSRFLICSDGLTDMLPPPQVEELMVSERDADSAASSLFAAAMAAGGLDNITVVVVDVTRLGRERG